MSLHRLKKRVGEFGGKGFLHRLGLVVRERSCYTISETI